MERSEAEAIYDSGREACVEFLMGVMDRQSRSEERLRVLEAKGTPSSRTGSSPPSADTPKTRQQRRAQAREKAKELVRKEGKQRKAGGQPGHRGAGRRLLGEDQMKDIVDHYPGECGGCGRQFSEGEKVPRHGAGRHQVAELPETAVFYVEHRAQRLRCPCGKRTRGTLGTVGESPFGPLRSGGRRILVAMARAAIPPQVDELVAKLAAVPGVVAVALGGSRATGGARADSDWDLGVYYRSGQCCLDPDDVRALGYEGEVSGLGAWGPIVNGGAWLTIEGTQVDLLFRDLDLVEHWLSEAHAGRFEVLDQHGCLVGAPTYILVGELALGQPLTGQLPRGEFSDALVASASSYWHGRARVSLMFAGIYAQTAERVCCVGMLASAILCAAHSRLASRREWALNEKRLVERAGLRHVEALITGQNESLVDLAATVTRVSAATGVDPLRPR